MCSKSSEGVEVEFTVGVVRVAREGVPEEERAGQGPGLRKLDGLHMRVSFTSSCG